jgi:hypothetical protein
VPIGFFTVDAFECAICYRKEKLNGGPERVRTDDIQLAKLALYQLSYRPTYSQSVDEDNVELIK